MPINDGIYTSTAFESSIFGGAQSNSRHWATWIDLTLMQADDEIKIIIYVQDVVAGTMKKYKTASYKNAQTDVMIFLPFVPTDKYDVTLQRIAGTDRDYKWRRVEQTLP